MASVPASDSGIAQRRKRLVCAAAIALVSEALVVGAAIALLTHTVRVPSLTHEAPSTLLTLVAPAPALAPVLRPSQPQSPQPQIPQRSARLVPLPARPAAPVHDAAHAPAKPVTAAAPKPVSPPSPVQPAATSTEPHSTPAPPPRAQPTPQPSAPTAQPAQQPPSPAASADTATPTPSFDAALRAAIQASLHYPASARMAGMTGRTRVAFKYRDGIVSDLSVLVSSGIGLLDRAALAAVRDAAYPKPEPAFVGKTLSEQLWVDFKLDDHD